ncbi:hypothetical protein [Cupriavidus sp. IDO]|uniref:hypothetical protein n=1 Tax=Cupriavidus sp. IDO TaxID=1539142 RepID=UPI00057952EF|nr:hypothetical protein [Cupriavidus sp. IDO]
MKRTASARLALSLLMLAGAGGLSSAPAQAHGVIGKRFLPATITVDDPFVSDEASLVVGHRKLPQEESAGAAEIDMTTFSTELSKRITPDLGLSLGATYQRVRPDDGTGAQYGFDNLGLGLKYQVIKNAEHEAIVSVGVDADLGGTGSSRVGAESFSTLSPSLFYGKGFGDLPDAVKYLRPLAITGIVSPELPTRRSEPDRLNWGFTVQYSLQYLQTYVRDVGLGAPFNRMIALIEVPVKTCLSGDCSGQTTGTVNPGVMWFGKYVQVALEAAIPLNRRSGHDVGAFLQFHWFLDDMFPKGIGKPIFP